MFYELKLKDYISLTPDLFDSDLEDAINKKVIEKYSDFNEEQLGLVLSVVSIDNIGEGFKLPEDYSRHYTVEFSVLTFKPELNEVAFGSVSSITTFGAFVDIGPIEALVHQSQIMNDQISNENGIIIGQKSKNQLKEGEEVLGSIVAVSFKDIKNIRLGMTLRQPGLGGVNWK